MTNEQFELLKKPFKPNEVQWRITATSKGTPQKGLAVPYLDSRAIQNRLDEVIGRENWQNNFATQAMMKDNAFICTISIYCAERGEWVIKSNGAGSTDIEPIKGGLSDAFKRAASMWNIGRYLYEFTGVWVTLDERKAIVHSELPRLEKIYIEKVKELFPKAYENKPIRPVNIPVKQPPIQSVNNSEQQSAIQLIAAVPIYTVINARLNQNHTIIELSDGVNPAVTAYFNGEAKLAKNQCITDVIVQKKSSTAGEYYVLESYRIADGYNDNYRQAA